MHLINFYSLLRDTIMNKICNRENLIIVIFLWCCELKLIIEMFNLMEIFIPIEFVFWLYIIHNSQHLKELCFFLPRRQWLKLDFIYCISLLVSLLTACNCKFHNPGISGSMSVSKQQHTYPSPNPSLDRTCYQFTLIRLVVFPSFPALSAKGALLEKTKQRLLIRPEASLHLLTHSGWMTTKLTLLSSNDCTRLHEERSEALPGLTRLE